jgi:DNA mismatch repair ATPase MutS
MAHALLLLLTVCCLLCLCRTVLSDARPSSLVLVDELGKGTEVVSGTAIAAGILRDLAAKGSM